MYFPKRYGQSRDEKCPFCGKSALTESREGVPVCTAHKSLKLPDLKCACGSYLEPRKGKFGAFFSCMKCGNVSFSRAMSINDASVIPAAPAPEEKAQTEKTVKKELVVRSDELDFLY